MVIKLFVDFHKKRPGGKGNCRGGRILSNAEGSCDVSRNPAYDTRMLPHRISHPSSSDDLTFKLQSLMVELTPQRAAIVLEHASRTMS